MTTLPQTTPVRVPPGLGPGLNFPIPGAPGGGMPPAGGMTGADVWRVIRTNLWLIILLLVVSAAAGYGVHRLLLRYMPEYTASTMLEIDTRQYVNLVDNQTTDMADSRVLVELRTQAEHLKSPQLFSAVLTRPDSRVRDTRWFKSFEQTGRLQANISPATRAKEELRDKFRVAPVPDSKLLLASFSAASAEDSRVVLVELIQEHLRQQREQTNDAYNRQLTSLRRLGEELRARIGTRAKQIEVAQRNLATAGMPVERNTPSVRTIELETVIKSRIEAAAEYEEARAALEMIEASNAGERPSRVREAVEIDPLMLSLVRQVLELSIHRDTQRDQRGPEHVDVRRLDRQVDAINAEIEKRRAELLAKYDIQYRDGVRGQAASTKNKFERLVEEEKRLRGDMGLLTQDLANLLVWQAEIGSWRVELLQVENKVRDLEAIAALSSASRIRWGGPPETPEIPSFPKLKVVMPLAIFIGLALALGIAFLRELLNDTVRSPRDIARVGQMTLLGLICDEADDPQAADAKLPIFDAPHSMTAEQFRQMRTRLNQAASLDTTRSLMITGPSPEDGKTTVAANLSAGLALNGRRILLVDANFRRPELHRLFGVGNEGGFAEVLTGQAGLEQHAHATRIPNLSVLPSGPKPANVTELFESQLLIDFIENALQTYDHVIFDSGPLLVVSESAAMAPRVDGVITVVRAHAESRGLLQRMRDSLRQLKAEHIGVVLNAVRAQGGGYYRRNIKTYYEYQA